MWGSTKKLSVGKLYDQCFLDLWTETDVWERAATDEDDLWSKESDENWALIQRAAQLGCDETAAFELHLEGAKAGSVWCQQMVGWHYWAGKGVAADQYLALKYYHSAICGGSWIATLHYARLLYEVGQYDDCERILSDGVASGFVPSYYWLAWFRHKRRGTRAVRKEVRPLVEYAAESGHPAAKFLLARWMVSGKLRLRDIPLGCLMVVRDAIAYANRDAQQGKRHVMGLTPAN